MYRSKSPTTLGQYTYRICHRTTRAERLALNWTPEQFLDQNLRYPSIIQYIQHGRRFGKNHRDPLWIHQGRHGLHQEVPEAHAERYVVSTLAGLKVLFRDAYWSQHLWKQSHQSRRHESIWFFHDCCLPAWFYSPVHLWAVSRFHVLTDWSLTEVLKAPNMRFQSLTISITRPKF